MRRRSLTLVELMVAVALGSILVGVITFVWMQSNKIFSSTVNRLEAYQRLRSVLDVMERDLANTARSVDMEFYIDANGNGHFDPDPTTNPTEKLIGHGTGTGGAAVPETSAGAHRRPIDLADPLRNPLQTEFNEAGNANFSALPYFYAPLVLSPTPYQIPNADYLIRRAYWQDEVMVRTFAMANGVNRSAVVHYRLVRQADGRSALRRRVWHLSETGALVRPDDPSTASTDESGGQAPTDLTSILAYDLCDLKVGFFFKESASSQTGSSQANGYWYHVGPAGLGGAGTPERDLLDQDEQGGYLRAIDNPDPNLNLSIQHLNRSQFGGGSWSAVQFFYGGGARVEFTSGRTELRTLDETVTTTGGLLAGMPVTNNLVNYPVGGYAVDGAWGPVTAYTNFDFPGVRPGDQIFLYDAHDDDADNWDTNGDGNPDRLANAVFPDGVFTVDVITSDLSQKFVALSLKEPINLHRLRRRWLKVEPPYDMDVSGNASATWGPNRTVDASFNVRYRVGFLPAAFRIQLSVDDKYNHKVLPMERVIRLLQQ